MSARRQLLTVAAAAAAVACPSAWAARNTVAAAACGGVETAAAQNWHHSLPPLAIGDSTMLLALPGLARAGFDVNAHGCRQYPEALELLSQLAHAKQLPHLVAIALGANGSIEPAEIARALAILGTGRVLVLLTPRELGGGSGSDAQLVRAEGHRHGANLVVLDWVAYSADHPDWFEPDGLHVNPTGAAGMSRLISTVLPLATTPGNAKTPHCEPTPAASPTSPASGSSSPATGSQGIAPEPPTGEPLRAITISGHDRVLLIDPRTRRLRIQVTNPNAQVLSGLVRLRAEGREGRTVLAAACAHVPQAGSVQLEIPVSNALLADAELLSRFEAGLELQLATASGAETRSDSSYILRTAGR